MAKRTSQIQKLVAFALTVTEDELNNVVEVITAIRGSRFPKTPKKAAVSRKPRADRGTTRKGLPAADASKPNGGDEVGGEQ